MMTAPRITVIMPVYNSVQYVETAIKSVLNQTYSQLELLIIDDGSNDGTREIINQQQQSDDRIRLICLDNQGSGAARNKGLRRGTGEYVAFQSYVLYFNHFVCLFRRFACSLEL